MLFWKMQGCGNDYVVVDGREEKGTGEERAGLARRICDRHYGVGADGMLWIQEGRKAAFEMEMYNPDGSRGEMCGNGIRCAGKYILDRGLTKEREFEIESMGAVKRLKLLTQSDERIGGAPVRTMLSVDMGRPVEKGEISMRVTNRGGLDETLTLHCVSMGNPHAVVLTDNLDEEQTIWIGPRVERAAEFPGGTNVEFVKVLDRSHISMRVWERGAGETLACGTGACAAAEVCMQKDLTDEEITVKLLGGELMVSGNQRTGHLILTGPAETVFFGEIVLRFPKGKVIK